jgi:prevent-host-death family protein
MNGRERQGMIFLAQKGRLPYIRAMDNALTFSDVEAITAESAGERLSEVIDHAVYDRARVVLTRDGKPVAAIVPIEDYDALEAIEDAFDAKLAADAIAAWEAAGRPPGIPMADVARELGIDLSKP